MPSYERIFDAVRIDVAKTPEDRSYWRGFAKGKSRARFEVAALALFIAILIVLEATCPF